MRFVFFPHPGGGIGPPQPQAVPADRAAPGRESDPPAAERYRLLRAYLEQNEGRPVSEVVAVNRWLAEVYDPVVAAIPEDLRGRLAPAEIFHEILEHRWYMSERAGRDVGTAAAARSYFERVLPQVPESLDTAAGSE